MHIRRSYNPWSVRREVRVRRADERRCRYRADTNAEGLGYSHHLPPRNTTYPTQLQIGGSPRLKRRRYDWHRIEAALRLRAFSSSTSAARCLQPLVPRSIRNIRSERSSVSRHVASAHSLLLQTGTLRTILDSRSVKCT